MERTGQMRRRGEGGRNELRPSRGEKGYTMKKSGFTLIEVLVSMTVLLLLVMGMTRLFTQASAISNQGMTSIARNSVAETAMETMLQDVDGMIVNERLGCYIGSDTEDAGTHGFGFDEVYFVSTSGDQDDDMPYEYFHYYVDRTTVTNSLGAPFVRFDLHKARMIMAVGDNPTRAINTYALAKDKANWWDKLGQLGNNSWDDQVLAENVVRFDLYCLGWDGAAWMSGKGSSTEFDSRTPHYAGSKLGNVANVPPAAFDIYLQVTSPDAAMEGGMALVSGMGSDLEVKGRELMIKESASYFGRAVPMTGVAQLHHPENHYLD